MPVDTPVGACILTSMSTPTSSSQAAKFITTIAANILTPSSPGYINPASVPVPTLAYAYDTGITYTNVPNKAAGVFIPVWVEVSRAGFDIDDHAVRGVVLQNVASLAAFSVNSISPSTDGLTYIAGNRVLLVMQTVASQNGVYSVGTVTAGVAPLTRVLDMPSGAIIPAATYVYVSEGTIGGGSFYRQVTPGPVTIGTTSLVFVQMPNAVTGPFRARGVFSANTAITTGTITATCDTSITLVAGDRVLLAHQTTGSQSGLYLVMSVTAGVATVQLAPEWQQGAVLAGCIVEVSEGTVWTNSTWKATAPAATAGGYYTVNTTDPLFFPRMQQGAAVPGAITGVFLTPTGAINVTDETAAAAVGVSTIVTGRGTGSFTTLGTGGHTLQWNVVNF
jgi:hypothetical protein